MTAELEELNRLLAEFPPQLVSQVLSYAQALKLTPSGLDYDTDEPTDEELRASSNRDMERFEDEHPGEDWSQQSYTPGYK